MMLIKNTTDELVRAGLYVFGSDALERYESRMVRVFERSYEQALRPIKTLDMLGVSARTGPMVEKSSELMEKHYDEQLPFFEAILDRRYRAYSMAYYGETASAARTSTASLEEAQRAKFELFCQRTGLQGDEKIFNIGCGFGSLETFLLEQYSGITVVGITPSTVQIAYLKRRMADPKDVLGQGRFHLLEGGFDTTPVEKMGRDYDVIFSVGVLEHFKNLEAAFARQTSLLKPGGRTFHHLIVSQYPIPGFADQRDTRLRTYFPGGRLWPFDELKRDIGGLEIESAWYVNGLNYWRTIHDWHSRYWQHAGQLYPDVFTLDTFRFWNEYFTVAKVMFAPKDGSVVGNGQFLYRKPRLPNLSK